MRNHVAVWIVVAHGIAFHGYASASEKETKTYQSSEVGRKIVQFIERAESAGFSGVVLAAKEGKVVAAVGVGAADLDGKTPITPATLFEIASATKPFTAAAVMKLVQDGKLKLDDSIADHLPGVPENCKKITVRHLLQHTSGIPGTNSFGAGTDLDKVLPFFLRGGPKRTPGTNWEYWNQGYSLASEVIARASGKSYTDYCKEALFTPAKMTATCFTGDKPPNDSTVAIGQSTRGKPRSALEHPYGNEYGFQYRGMGGVVTNVWDLWRWDRALHDDQLLAKESKEEMFKPGLKQYALGWNVRKDAQGRLVQSHGGGVRGFVCEVRRYPNEDGCLFVLCNRDDAPVRQIAQAVEQILFGDPGKSVEPPRALDADLMKAIAGRYKDQKGAILVVEPKGKVARMRIEWYVRGPITYAVLGQDKNGDVVLFEWTDSAKLKIERLGSGDVKSVSLSDRRFVRMK